MRRQPHVETESGREEGGGGKTEIHNIYIYIYTPSQREREPSITCMDDASKSLVRFKSEHDMHSMYLSLASRMDHARVAACLNLGVAMSGDESCRLPSLLRTDSLKTCPCEERRCFWHASCGLSRLRVRRRKTRRMMKRTLHALAPGRSTPFFESGML